VEAPYSRERPIIVCSKAQRPKPSEVSPRTVSSFTMATTARQRYQAEQLLVASGRTPNPKTSTWRGHRRATEGGAIQIDKQLKPLRRHLCPRAKCRPAQFVYVARPADSRRCRHHMTGVTPGLDLSAMLRWIFTDPQVDSVGLSEAELLQRWEYTTDSRTLTLDKAEPQRALVNFDTGASSYRSRSER